MSSEQDSAERTWAVAALVVAVVTYGLIVVIGHVVLRYPFSSCMLLGYVLLLTEALAVRGVWPGYALGVEWPSVFALSYMWDSLPTSQSAKWQWTAALILLPAAGFCLGRLYRRRRTATMETRTH